jgi:hypothetical protein
MVKTLKWMPYAHSDRIWPTKKLPEAFKKFPVDTLGRPGPHLLVRGKAIWVCFPLSLSRSALIM